MSDRPTPETDAAVKAEASNGQWSYVLRDTCARLERERDEAREALRDMLSGWKYIRQVHGDLSGVGWNRAQGKAEKALEAAK